MHVSVSMLQKSSKVCKHDCVRHRHLSAISIVIADWSPSFLFVRLYRAPLQQGRDN